MSDFIDLSDYDVNSSVFLTPEQNAILDNKVNKILGQALWTPEDEKDFIEYLKTSEKGMAFFEKYHPDSVKHFYNQYISNRQLIVQEAQLSLKAELSPRFFSNTVEDYFYYIQQKKLFEKQCLWRAKKIDIPCIKCSADFIYWQFAIKSCHFIDLVTPQEVELLKQFLREHGEDLNISVWATPDFQNYVNIKSGEDSPLFYEYWDEHFGTGHLLKLEDVRGKIESGYRAYIHKENLAKAESQAQSAPSERPKRLVPFYEDAFMSEMVEQFEHKDYKRIYYKYKEKEKKKKSNVDVDIKDLIELSDDVPAKFPIVTKYDSWRSNVAATISKYRHGVYADEMDDFYDVYNLHHEMELPIELDDHNIKEMKSYQFIAEMVREQIMKGRELAGEPRDWSFL